MVYLKLANCTAMCVLSVISFVFEPRHEKICFMGFLARKILKQSVRLQVIARPFKLQISEEDGFIITLCLHTYENRISS